MRNIKSGRNVLQGILDAGPYIIIGTSFLVGIASIIALLLADIYTGQIAGQHQTNDFLYGLLISLGGTGMIVAASGFLMEGLKRKWDWRIVAIFGTVVIILQVIDSYFDASSVDIKRFGELVFAHDVLSPAEARGFIMYRFFVAGISLIGEPLATGAVLFFPVLKRFLKTVLGVEDVDEDKPYSESHSRGSFERPLWSPSVVNRANNHTGKPSQTPNYKPPNYHPVGKMNNED